jgi:putative peptide zinc metalloprotease protein
MIAAAIIPLSSRSSTASRIKVYSSAMPHPTPMIEQNAPAVLIPRLKPNIQFAPFDDVSTGDEYIFEVGSTCFVVNKYTRDVLLALNEQPETLEELAQIYARQTQRQISIKTLGNILNSGIPPALLSHTSESPKRTPFIISFPILPEKIVRPVTSVLKHFYRTPVVVSFLSAFLVVECLVMPEAFNAFRGAFHVFSFTDFFLFYAAIIGSMLVHEMGHASACRYYECPHGPIGFGLYIIFPGFYTDVTKAWRLPRWRRTVVNLGGLYFQSILVVCMGSYAWLYQSQFWWRMVWITNFMMLYTLNPVLKQDGYWVLSDLSGLRNLHDQMRQTAAGLFSKATKRPSGRASGNAGLRLKVLYIYMALVAVYSLYFANFIYHALSETARHYPSTVEQFVLAMRVAWSRGQGLEILLLLLQLLWHSFLPLLLGILLFRLFYQATRYLSRRIRVKSARKNVTV